ncbi:DEAD/DEAH box helicase [Salegentibacter sp. BLCTC]|uniref:DEAD/DEAH box helicase n=1 Tax=Salegentibacter sp. BLCTC TaxID=2697368 RepID=UPI00187B9D2F|nr:DEAD/DEAH box helicase [Salegentibacter sp. BLCTC]MBE7641405.1 DEAD/DEAH box helicase [Salegentibacter sp. BLCTC]
MAESISANKLRELLTGEFKDDIDKWTVVKSISTLIDNDRSIGQEMVLRLLSKKECFLEYQDIINEFVRKIGLYPYLNQEDLSLEGNIAYEFHKPEGLGEEMVFHHAQAEIYYNLLQGENIVLSAPTSFGKSLIIDAIIASKRHINIAVIVPTIALIDETRKRLSKFKDEYKIITHPSQALSEKNVLVLTQERALDIIDRVKIDFFIIDEFYKLNPKKTDIERTQILNQVFYLLVKQDAQFYLLGPNIQEISTKLLNNVSFKFIKTDFKTVISETHRIKVPRKKNQEQVITELVQTLSEPTLIFCRSPRSANKLASHLIEHIHNGEDKNEDLAGWLEENYHGDWILPNCIRKGIGIHHGKIPRSIAQKTISLFNNEKLNFLICTSTIIEGVNTKAKNVIIYDNKIARSKFDYFTFNNICGRSGRMFAHFIGNIYLFHEPPPEELPLVDFPAFSQNDEVSKELLINLNEEDLKENSKKKISKYLEQSFLPKEVLQKNSFIELDRQLNLAVYIQNNLHFLHKHLSWSNIPSNSQLKEVCIIIWDYFVDSNARIYGVSSGLQLHYRLMEYRESKNLKQYLSKFVKKDSDIVERNKAIELAFDIQKYWINFQFPRYLSALDKIVNHVFEKNGLKGCDYSVYANLVESYFSKPYVVPLDEYGIPIPISLKIGKLIELDNNIDESLYQLKHFSPDNYNLSDIEKEFIYDLKEYL